MLAGATINATNFSGAFLWRTQWGNFLPGDLGAVWLDETLELWKPVWGRIRDVPVPWTANDYAELRNSMNSIPEGEMRDNALERIKILNCGNRDADLLDEDLASCDPAVPPPEVQDWQKALLKANVNETAFPKALAMELRNLVCGNDANAIYILRGISGIIEYGRLWETGREALALVEFIMSKDCLVSASLTDDDKSRLLKSSNTRYKNPRLPRHRTKRIEPATGP